MKEKFRCGHCNYQFFTARQPGVCPYCAQPGVVREVEFFNIEKELENM